ncbi:hypothetical protein [Candidatus Symbiopectobacterium sp. NZEC135]|uniref:hypothetical protein n=1 Tax=Candidatus Symbiopectobacterium sp. NZEC135 TaxID=2820471 RepID=UPI0022266FDF|nr:hypothetical protein [Candidatus Symbiopectobacterium sp. NZEC135]MCW2481587.1 hypothetical protein [Candidatus Symbiopectobacterium sp. NZEC135]
MINIDSLDKFSCEYLSFLRAAAGVDLRDQELYLAEDYSLVESIQKDINNINLAIDLFIEAKKNNDVLAMRAALLHIRCFMLGVSGVFRQTVDDIDRLFKLPTDISFPENYKLPEHYNYPIK